MQGADALGFPGRSERTISPEFVRARQPTPTSRTTTKTTGEPIQALCPWCAQTFTRRHDFKKHARDFHLSRMYWLCRNPSCQERTCSERQAKLHPNRTGLVDCKNLGSSKTILQRDKRHFGCPHCARYHDDAEAFLEHLARDCCPGKAPGSAHQSLQVRALLQQVGLKPLVESYCLRLRGDCQAYKLLWWTWNKSIMAERIQRLEYGVQEHVDTQHPGIGRAEVDGLLTELLAPSSKSVFEAEILCGRAPRSPAAAVAVEKPLPPLPVENTAHAISPPYHQESVFRRTREYLRPREQQFSIPSPVQAWQAEQQACDPMIAGSFSEEMDGMDSIDLWQGFGWYHLAEGINFDVMHTGGFSDGR